MGKRRALGARPFALLPWFARVLVCAGCEDTHGRNRASTATGPRGVPSVRASAAPIPGSCVSARIDVAAERAADVRVRYGRDASYGQETPWRAVPPGGIFSTTLIGLEPDAETHFEVWARGSDQATSSTGDLTVRTTPLDPNLPRIANPLNRSTANDFVLLSMNDKAEGRGLAAMVDRRGKIVWYRWGGPLQYAFDRLPNGNFIQHHLGITAFEEVGLDGAVVRTWRNSGALWGADGHDYQFLPGDRALVFGVENRDRDPRRAPRSGVPRALRVDNVVSEVTAEGDVRWQWSTFSHVSESELTPDPSEPDDPKSYEIAHLNSIEPLPDGNLWLSLRNTSTVVKVDRRTGNVVWRLGGKRSDFRFINDPLEGFWRQHDARRLPNGNVLLFDNGNLHEPAESRAVEYRLDEEAKTATLVWQYRRTPPLFARIAGSARRSADGHTLVSYGPRGVVSEVDERATPVWEISAYGFGIFRAIAVPSLYP